MTEYQQYILSGSLGLPTVAWQTPPALVVLFYQWHFWIASPKQIPGIAVDAENISNMIHHSTTGLSLNVAWIAHWQHISPREKITEVCSLGSRLVGFRAVLVVHIGTNNVTALHCCT